MPHDDRPLPADGADPGCTDPGCADGDGGGRVAGAGPDVGGDGARLRAGLGVPLPGLASAGDVLHAEQLLVLHAPRTFCLTCQTAWPCPDVRYARVITAGQAVWGSFRA